MRTIRLPGVPRRVRYLAAGVGAAALVSSPALVSAGPPSWAAAPKPTTTVTVTQTVTATVTATVTQTVTETVTAPATTTTTVPTTTTSSTTTTTTAAPAGCPILGANKAGATDPFGGCFPGPGNVGVPAGTQLAAYTGPIAIDSANDLTVLSDNVTIDSKTVGVQGGRPVHIRVAAKNFTLKNSVLYGIVTQVDGYAASYTVQDSKIDSTGDTDFKSATGSNITLLRNDILGSFSGGVCDYCTVQDNWFHGQWIPAGSTAHMSAYRMDQYTKMTHNTLSCDFVPPLGLNDPAGCSADLTGYGDWGPVQFNTIARNLFQANPTALYYCAYGGSSGSNGSKPYGAQANNVVFDSNVFQKGSSGKCGAAGPVVDFDPARPGNAWTGNIWDDGSAVAAS